MERGAGLHHGAHSSQALAACDEEVGQVVEGGHHPIDDRLIDQRPEAFHRLQLRRIRGQEDQVQPIRDAQVRTAMPARLIEDEHHGMGAIDPHLQGEGVQSVLETRNGHRRQQQPEGLTTLRFDEADDIQPLVPRADQSQWL